MPLQRPIRWLPTRCLYSVTNSLFTSRSALMCVTRNRRIRCASHSLSSSQAGTVHRDFSFPGAVAITSLALSRRRLQPLPGHWTSVRDYWREISLPKLSKLAAERQLDPTHPIRFACATSVDASRAIVKQRFSLNNSGIRLLHATTYKCSAHIRWRVSREASAAPYSAKLPAEMLLVPGSASVAFSRSATLSGRTYVAYFGS